MARLISFLDRFTRQHLMCPLCKRLPSSLTIANSEPLPLIHLSPSNVNTISWFMFRRWFPGTVCQNGFPVTWISGIWLFFNLCLEDPLAFRVCQVPHAELPARWGSTSAFDVLPETSSDILRVEEKLSVEVRVREWATTQSGRKAKAEVKASPKDKKWLVPRSLSFEEWIRHKWRFWLNWPTVHKPNVWPLSISFENTGFILSRLTAN